MRSCFLVIVLLTSSFLSAQSLTDQKVTLRFKNATLLHCLKVIENKADLTFSYNLSTLKSEKKLTTKTYTQKKVGQILDDIFEGTALNYKEIANQITIYSVKSKTSIVSLSGYILDKASEEKIIGAKLFFSGIEEGCVTNPYGFYHIEMPTGKYDLIISSVGMKSQTRTISIENNLMLNFELEEDTFALKPIEVNAKHDSAGTVNNKVATLEKMVIEPALLYQTPSSNGLPDVTKYVQNIAGVQPLHDGSSSYQIRGLSNGNNLILLDEIPIYHPNHLLGIYSIINANAVKSATFYKDHIPAKFGIRNSSILEIYTKEGNLKKFQFDVGSGASVPHLSLQGPIIKNKASYYISGRRSFDALNSINFLPPTDLPNPNFFDLTLKLNYKLNYQNRIYFTSYIGNDRIDNLGSRYNWGNNSFAFRWNRVISDRTFTNLTLINSIFNYKIDEQNSTSNFGQKVISSQIKYNVSYFISNSKKLNYGLSVLNTRTLNDRTTKNAVFLNRNGYETALYANLVQKINPRITLDAGVRLPYYFHIGTQDTSQFLRPDLTRTQIIYTKNKPYDFKLSIDPRILLTYRLNPKNSLQLSENIATQFTHIVNYNTKVLPVQIWTTPSKFLRPERNYQTSLALIHNEKYLNLSSIVFYRYVSNVLDYAHSTYPPHSDIESNLLSGKLIATGFEFMAHYQKSEKYSAQFSYSYTYSRQTIKGINNNQPYVPAYSRPHYISFNQFYKRSKKWEFGGNFVFHSKTALTLPTGKIEVNGVEYPVYDGLKNTSRLPIHHRLDISLKRTLGIKKQKNRGYFMLTLTNIYGRQNISNSFLAPSGSNTLDFRNQNYIPQSAYLYYFFKLK